MGLLLSLSLLPEEEICLEESLNKSTLRQEFLLTYYLQRGRTVEAIRLNLLMNSTMPSSIPPPHTLYRNDLVESYAQNLSQFQRMLLGLAISEDTMLHSGTPSLYNNLNASPSSKFPSASTNSVLINDADFFPEVVTFSRPPMTPTRHQTPDMTIVFSSPNTPLDLTTEYFEPIDFRYC